MVFTGLLNQSNFATLAQATNDAIIISVNIGSDQILLIHKLTFGLTAVNLPLSEFGWMNVMVVRNRQSPPPNLTPLAAPDDLQPDMIYFYQLTGPEFTKDIDFNYPLILEQGFNYL